MPTEKSRIRIRNIAWNKENSIPCVGYNHESIPGVWGYGGRRLGTVYLTTCIRLYETAKLELFVSWHRRRFVISYKLQKKIYQRNFTGVKLLYDWLIQITEK